MKRIRAVFVLVLLVAVLIAAGSWVREFIAVDSCLDHGGRWDEHGKKCEMAAPAEQ